MADRLELAFRRGFERLVPRDCSVLAAVSGGGDSVALLHLLRRFAPRRQVSLTVAHLDHGLRRDSRADRRFVERLAAELTLPCTAERREVPLLKRAKESPEEAARRVRRAFLLEARKQCGAALIVTGHTLDDQAETILMRLVRGAGSTALTGMAESGPGPFVRPLLEIERAELRAYLRRRRFAYREDPTNRDLRFDRNRLRRLVLPLLAETLNPRAARHLVKSARLMREDSLLLDRLAEQALSELSSVDRSGRLVLDCPALAGADPPVARRVARLALGRAGADGRRVAARHVEALLDLARGAGGRQLHLPGRLVARRIKRRIVIHAESGRPR
jgi:tRNA(Ile)-lysidine synthase